MHVVAGCVTFFVAFRDYSIVDKEMQPIRPEIYLGVFRQTRSQGVSHVTSGVFFPVSICNFLRNGGTISKRLQLDPVLGVVIQLREKNYIQVLRYN